MEKEIIKALEGCIKKLHLNPKERIALDQLIERKIDVKVKKILQTVKDLLNDYDMNDYYDEFQEDIINVIK